MTTIVGDVRLELRMPGSLKEDLEKAAVRQQQSLAEFATEALAEAVRRVLGEVEDRRQVNLSARDMERFLAVLDADVPPNAALSGAVAFHRQTAARRSGE